MASKLLTRSATVLGAVATTGALVLGTPGLAQAAVYERGTSDSEQNRVNGSGDADARARATDTGRLAVSTEADGGDLASQVPGGAASDETRATARASLQKRIPVAEGNYRIAFNYDGLKGRETDRGADASARAVRKSMVKFVSQTGDDNRAINRVQQVPSSKSDARTVLLLSIPNNASGFLRVKAILKAVSTADGQGNFAHADASVNDVSFRVTRA